MWRLMLVGMLIAGGGCDPKKRIVPSSETGSRGDPTSHANDVWSGPTHTMRSTYRHYKSFGAAAAALGPNSVSAIVIEGSFAAPVLVVEVRIEPAAGAPREFVTIAGSRRTAWSVATGNTSGMYRVILPGVDETSRPHTEPAASAAPVTPNR